MSTTREALLQDLAAAINKQSRENGSNTPDFILAEFIEACLTAFETASRAREKWYGKSLSIGGSAALAAEPLPTAEPEVVAADPKRPLPACYTDPEWLARYHGELLKGGVDERLPLPTAGWQEEQKLLTLGEARTYLEIAKMADKRAQTYDEVCVPLLDFAFTLRQMAVPLPFPPFPSDPPAEKNQ